MFRAIDTDGSGQLDVPEFAQLLKGIGLNLGEEEIHEIFDKYDVDDSKIFHLIALTMLMMVFVRWVHRPRGVYLVSQAGAEGN